jgi:hypothetical protein
MFIEMVDRESGRATIFALTHIVAVIETPTHTVIKLSNGNEWSTASPYADVKQLIERAQRLQC